MVGITRSGKRVPGANTQAIRTPREGAPTVAAATATSSTRATVRLTPPTNGQTVSLYTVSLCLKAQPTRCKQQNSTSIQLYFTGLAAGAQYLVSATAKIGSTTVPASNTLPLAMPQQGAPILLTAAATTALTGTATAAAPSNANFGKVGTGRVGVLVSRCRVAGARGVGRASSRNALQLCMSCTEGHSQRCG